MRIRNLIRLVGGRSRLSGKAMRWRAGGRGGGGQEERNKISNFLCWSGLFICKIIFASDARFFVCTGSREGKKRKKKVHKFKKKKYELNNRVLKRISLK